MIRSYKIAEIIVKLGHAHTVAETVMNSRDFNLNSDAIRSSILRELPLHNDSIQRSIYELSVNIAKQLTATLKGSKISIQIEKT